MQQNFSFHFVKLSFSSLFIVLWLPFAFGTFVPSVAHAQLEIFAGYDLFQTDGCDSLLDLPPLPADFFDPGSDPFSGPPLNFSGMAIDPPVLGATDTQVQRLAPVDPLLGDPPVDIPIELVALSLQSCEPITVTHSDGSAELWDVRLTLPDSVPRPQGSMNVVKTHPNGGIFDSFLPVQPLFTFTRISDGTVQILDCSASLVASCQLLFQSNGVPWVYEPCSPEILRVPGVTSNFCASATGSGAVQTTATDGTSSHVYLPTLTDLEFCGDGIIQPLLGEVCDDGNTTGGDGCDAFCQPEPIVPTCNGLPATIIGTSGDDLLMGTNGDDVIVGLGGNDVLRGKNGNDVLCGNEGNDELRGGLGADILFGQDGDDALIGGRGSDQLFGGSGNDELYGQRGSDVACGGTDDDTLYGGKGADRMDGGTGVDTMKGGKASDICANGESLQSCEDISTPVPECADE